MKKIIQSITLFSLIIIGINCTYQKHDVLDPKSMLIKEIINESEKVKINGNEKVVIVLSKYCEEIDCIEYFKNYKESVLFYKREDIFMRGLRKHTVIENIDSKNKSAIIQKGRFIKTGEKYTPEIIEIKI